MKKQTSSSIGNIFLIVLLLVLFGVLYVYVTKPSLLLGPMEKFSDKSALIPGEKCGVGLDKNCYAFDECSIQD